MKTGTSAYKLKTCRKCKAPLNEKSITNYCQICSKKIDEIFDSIREYLKEYPGSTTFEIEQRLGIPAHVINNFIKDGRLIEIPNEFLNMECLKCGCLLLSVHHKYCPPCEIEMIRGLNNAKEVLNKSPQKIEVKETGKMRFRSYWKD